MYRQPIFVHAGERAGSAECEDERKPHQGREASQPLLPAEFAHCADGGIASRQGL
jgi:hypothetical protein